MVLLAKMYFRSSTSWIPVLARLICNRGANDVRGAVGLGFLHFEKSYWTDISIVMLFRRQLRRAFWPQLPMDWHHVFARNVRPLSRIGNNRVKILQQII